MLGRYGAGRHAATNAGGCAVWAAPARNLGPAKDVVDQPIGFLNYSFQLNATFKAHRFMGASCVTTRRISISSWFTDKLGLILAFNPDRDHHDKATWSLCCPSAPYRWNHRDLAALLFCVYLIQSTHPARKSNTFRSVTNVAWNELGDLLHNISESSGRSIYSVNINCREFSADRLAAAELYFRDHVQYMMVFLLAFLPV